MKTTFLLLTAIMFTLSSAAKGRRLFQDANRVSDTIIKVAAHPELGFNYPYYLRLPKGMNSDGPLYLLVETNNSGVNDTLQHHEAETYLEIVRNSLGSNLCENLKIPLLMPVFPRPAKDWQVYTHALDRDAALLKKGDMKRLDLQLIAMTVHAREVLRGYRIDLQEKILLNGFSASGTFANRFTCIHPELVAGVACGGINGMLMLPVPALDDNKLKYPLGTADFKKLFEKDFDLHRYQAVPQYIYMGAKDDNDAVLFDDAYSVAERRLVFRVFSHTMLPDRFVKCETVYKDAKTNSTFRTYPNIGHATDKAVFWDVYDFFKGVIDKS